MASDLAEIHALEVTSKEVQEEADHLEAERPELEKRLREAVPPRPRAAAALAADTKAAETLDAQVEASRATWATSALGHSADARSTRCPRGSNRRGVASRRAPNTLRGHAAASRGGTRARSAEKRSVWPRTVSPRPVSAGRSPGKVRCRPDPPVEAAARTRGSSWAERIAGLETELASAEAAAAESQGRIDALSAAAR